MDIDGLFKSLNDFEERPYQKRIVAKAMELFTVQEAKSILIESPTGSGKTPMALIITKLLQDLCGYRVGWVSMRKNLLAQAALENINRGINADICFMSMFTKSIPPNLDMLVVDEAQHDAAGSMTHIHNVVQPKITLGMTATPYRTDRLKLCFDSVIKDAGIHRLIQDGYLSPYHHYSVPDWKPENVAQLYVSEREKWGKSLMFFHKLDQCRETQRLLSSHGVKCEVVSGSTDVERQLYEFRTGALEVLLNCQKLTEGFDAPDLRTVFCRGSMRGPTVQMCGRVFRKHPDIPYKLIVQPNKARWSFIRTAKPHRQFYQENGRWCSVTVTDAVENVILNVITELAGINAKLPQKLVQFNAGKGKKKQRWNDAAGTGPTESNPDGSSGDELKVELPEDQVVGDSAI